MATHDLKQTGSFAHTFTLTDAAGAALDLTGFTCTASGRMQRRTSVTFAFGITETDLPNGQVTVTLATAASGALEPTKYDFDVKAVSGVNVYFTPTDILNVQENIT